MNYIFGIFIILHGMVHLLYFGHSMRYFELKAGMAWPNGSWAFSNTLGNETSRSLASISLIVAALGLIFGGIGLLMNQAWWQPLIVCGATISSLVYILFWNGRTQNLDGQGLVGFLIDAAVLLGVLIFRWPASK